MTLPRTSSLDRYRADALELPAFDPMSTLLVRVEAVPRGAALPPPPKDGEEVTALKCVGYAVLNVFCAPGDAAAQPRSENTQEYAAQPRAVFLVFLSFSSPTRT